MRVAALVFRQTRQHCARRHFHTEAKYCIRQLKCTQGALCANGIQTKNSFATRIRGFTSTSTSTTASTKPYSYKPFQVEKKLYVKSVPEIQELVEMMKQEEEIAIDTEFLPMPFYRPRLETIQVALSNGVVALIDAQVMTLHRLKEFLGVLMTKTVIVHSCKGDLEILHDACVRLQITPNVPTKVFDTQLAASFVGYGGMVGYGKLVEDALEVTLDKSDTLSDWGVRPLSQKQIDYAMNDVVHLHPLKAQLTHELELAGRKEWNDHEQSALSLTELYARPTPTECWRSLRVGEKCESGSVELSVFKEVARWREVICMGQDMAPGLVLRNESMFGIALQKPTTHDSLRRIMGVKGKTLKLYSKGIIQAVERGIEAKEFPYHRVNHFLGDRIQHDLFALLNSRVQSKAREHAISPFLLAPRHELLDLSTVSHQSIVEIQKIPMSDPIWKPAESPSNFFNFNINTMPLEMTTMPASRYTQQAGSDPMLPYSLDEEVEMLTKSKTLSGWRRELIGNDLLAIAQGASLAWQPTQPSATPRKWGPREKPGKVGGTIVLKH